MDRRTFMGTLAAAGSAALLPRHALRGDGASAAQLDKIGLQLYTLRGAMGTSVERTLAQVAEIGYREVEFAGYFNRPPRSIGQLLKRNGLTAPSAHISTEPMKGRWLTTLDEASEIGHRYLVVASLGANEANTADAIKRTADLFNRAGEDAARYKITLGFHNHATEFKEVEGKRMYDAFLEATDPKRVAMELDLHWIYKGGADPFDYFAKWPGRFQLIHAKDVGPMPEGKMLNVGEGTIKWGEIFAKAKLAGIKHVFVEHDRPADPIADITASYKYLRALRY